MKQNSVDIYSDLYEQYYPLPNDDLKEKDKKITVRIILSDNDGNEFMRTEIDY